MTHHSVFTAVPGGTQCVVGVSFCLRLCGVWERERRTEADTPVPGVERSAWNSSWRKGGGAMGRPGALRTADLSSTVCRSRENGLKTVRPRMQPQN
eukprot:3502008-Amphidinium_carterae.2